MGGLRPRRRKRDRRGRDDGGSRRSSPTNADTRGAGSGSRVELELGLETAAADTVSAGTRSLRRGGDRRGGGRRQADVHTYAVPDDLGDVEAGEAVIVEFGRHRAWPSCWATRPNPRASRRNRSRHECEPTGRCCRPSPSRSRAGSPDTILSRPPGPPGDAPATDARTAGAGRRADAGKRRRPRHGRRDARSARPARRRAAARPGPRRAGGSCGPAPAAPRARVDGLVTVDWTLTAAGAGPRFERWILPTDTGRAAAADPAAVDGRPLGPRQRGRAGRAGHRPAEWIAQRAHPGAARRRGDRRPGPARSCR